MTADVNGPDGACVGRGAQNGVGGPLGLLGFGSAFREVLEHPRRPNRPRFEVTDQESEEPVNLDGRRPAGQARPMTDEKEKKPLERLNTADGRRELRAMLREIMAAAPDPGDRGHVANALLERLGIVLLDSTLIDITAFKGWFDGAYEAMLDDYPKRDEDR